MEPTLYNLKIEKAKNGYIVYTNENLINLSNGATAKDPIYVFESLSTLQQFLFEKFNINY
jgi:hypothetical protein